MTTRASAARYARALFDVALQESDPAQVERDLTAFGDLLAQNPELHNVLTNPGIPIQGKVGVVREIVARAGWASPVGKLLLMLAERDRLTIWRDFVEIYRERLLEHQQVIRAEVTTAAPLSPERTAAIEQRLATATGRRVMLSTKVDPSIIAGVVTRIGSTVYDGSVATQLDAMKQRLEQI
jgi:F-type H+-transporting ATPase subunit delta